MKQVSMISLDIAKRVFQAHGADTSGHVVFRKRLMRDKLLAFLRPSRYARWQWRRAPERTIGGASLAIWAIPCD